jgi:hypothetical protein
LKRTLGRKYPRRLKWVPERDAAFARAGRVCEVSGEPLGREIPARFFPARSCFWKWERAADHIIPERYVRRFIKGANPHIKENLVVVTPVLHAKKTAIEPKLFEGDFIGFCMSARALGYDQVLIDRAIKALYASAKERADASADN